MYIYRLLGVSTCIIRYWFLICCLGLIADMAKFVEDIRKIQRWLKKRRKCIRAVEDLQC